MSLKAFSLSSFYIYKTDFLEQHRICAECSIESPEYGIYWFARWMEQ